jgi:hypothetical protein
MFTFVQPCAALVVQPWRVTITFVQPCATLVVLPWRVTIMPLFACVASVIGTAPVLYTAGVEKAP